MESHAGTVLFFTPTILLDVINPPATTVLIILLLALMLLSFIVSGAEVAFFSLTYKDINLLKTKDLPQYKRIIDLLEEPKSLLGSLLVANTLANIAIIIVGSLVIDETVHFGNHMFAVIFAIKVIIIACLLILFCEVLPKVLANNNAIRYAKDMGLAVEIVYYIFKRLGNFLVKYTDVVEKRVGSNNSGQYNMEELDHAIGKTYSEENRDEKNILMGIAKFGNITVKQIMRSRLDINGIDNKSSFAGLVAKIEELHYSRLPVYNNDFDEVVGIINTKDILPYIDKPADFEWHSLMRPPYFVHEQKLIEDLLREFQQKHIHFAVVVDEFGGTSGIVTLEDILEEVIGEIKDEFDDEEPAFKKVDEYNYIFDGRTTLNDVCKFMELPLETFDNIRGQAESLAGLVLELAGEIPHMSEVVTSGDFDFAVLEIAKNRLQKIKVTIKPRKED